MKDALAHVGKAEVHIKVCLSHPAQTILSEAENKKAMLVVIGSRGRGFVSEIFIGSVSHNVARHSPVPVSLIPPKRSTHEQEERTL